LTAKEKLFEREVNEGLLSRWWVNGKPFVPAPDDPLRQQTTTRTISCAGLPSATAIWLELEFDPQRLGAERGDAIGLQMLYTDRGHAPIADEYAYDRRQPSSPVHDRLLLSNRIEFTVP
jgi:hypothetical protein